MVCKLCGSDQFNGSLCYRCGLPHYENPTVTPLLFGKHKGQTVEQVYNTNRSYLEWMIRQGAGTPAQRSMARLLIKGIKPQPRAEVIKSNWPIADSSSKPRLALDDLTGPPDLTTFVRLQVGTSEPVKPRPTVSQPSPAIVPARSVPIVPSQPRYIQPEKKGFPWSVVFWLFVATVIGGVILANASKNSTTTSLPTATTAPFFAAATATPIPARPTNNPTPQELSARGELTYETSSCRIKGNTNFDIHERIYHVPGGRYYDATVIDPRYGERWFCNEQDAVNNGWRKSEK